MQRVDVGWGSGGSKGSKLHNLFLYIEMHLCLFVTGVVFASFIAKICLGVPIVFYSTVLIYTIISSCLSNLHEVCSFSILYMYCMYTFLGFISQVVIIIQCQMVSVSIYYGLSYRALMMWWFCQEVCQEPRIWQR